MRQLLLYISCLFAFALQHAGAQQLDSLTRAQLSRQLDGYLAAIESSGPVVQIEETDFLIETPEDSLVRQYVAVKIYDHYLNSKVMGSETVAIHVLDKWFFSGKIKMYNDIDLLNAKIYADFNRQSLIGLKAPQLTLLTRNNESRDLFSEAPGAYKILYFYDAGCAKCKYETPRLVSLFAEGEYPVELIAVYVGDSTQAWDEYVAKYFSALQAGDVRITHLWDPEVDSDFQRKYGVLQTPRMLLIAPDGTIIGRGLDTEALELLLEVSFPEFQYGSPESEQLFDKLTGPDPTSVEISEISDMLAAATLDKGDVRMFKQLAGDYLYYLAPKTKQEYRYGLNRHVNKYILGRPDIWNTEDDSLKVVGFAQIMHDLINKTPVGEKIVPVKVKGILLSGGKEKVKKMRLDKLEAMDNIIIFHTTGCPVCAAEIAQARKLAEAYDRINFFLVNIDEVMASSPSKAAELFDAFDLSVLPHIVWTDENNIVRSCYVSLIDSGLMETYPLMGRVY
jgi:thiol-disulfide isomerase/thioredoxin